MPCLKQLSEFGCRIALDDFGTGYSSLSYLNRFPVDIVKVDQSFTRSLTTGTADIRRKSRMLIKGIRTISHQMGCTVVAEGIETKEQWELSAQAGPRFRPGLSFQPANADRKYVTNVGNGVRSEGHQPRMTKTGRRTGMRHLAFALVFLLSGTAHAQTLKLLTEEYPPYNFSENGVDQGRFGRAGRIDDESARHANIPLKSFPGRGRCRWRKTSPGPACSPPAMTTSATSASNGWSLCSSITW